MAAPYSINSPGFPHAAPSPFRLPVFSNERRVSPSPFRLDEVSAAVEKYVECKGGGEPDACKISRMLERRFKSATQDAEFMHLVRDLPLDDVVAWLISRDARQLEMEFRGLLEAFEQRNTTFTCTYEELIGLLCPMEDKKLCQLLGKLIIRTDCTYNELFQKWIYPDASSGWSGRSCVIDVLGEKIADKFLPQDRESYQKKGMRMVFAELCPQIGHLSVRNPASYGTLMSALFLYGRSPLVIEVMKAMEMTEEERIPPVKFLIQHHSQHVLSEIDRFGIESQAARIDLADFAISICARSTAESFRRFRIEDPMIRSEFAKICAIKNEVFTAKYIGNFELKNQQSDLAEIAELCLHAQRRVQFASKRNLTLVGVSRLCLQSNLEQVLQAIPSFGIRDQSALKRVANHWLILSPEYKGTLLAAVPLFGFQEESDCIDFIRNCVQKDIGLEMDSSEDTAKNILLQALKVYAYGSSHIDAKITMRTALECMKNMAQATGFRIRDEQALTAILEICAQRDPKLTAFYVDKVGIQSQGVQDKLIELCQDPFPKKQKVD